MSEWRRLRRDRWGMAGLAAVASVAALALLAPLLAPYDPNAVGLAAPASPPCWAHPLGTDAAGRDCLSRLLHGARVSVPIGLLAAAIACVGGALAGVLGGYLGGWVDRALTALADLLMSLPRLVLLLAAVALFGRTTEGRVLLIACLLGFTGWMPVARVVRAEVLSLREREHVLAARSLGLSPARIASRHVLPGALPALAVQSAIAVGNAILLEAALSFLGLGVPAPAPSWGTMVGTAMHRLDAWWLALFPGAAIAVTVLGFTLLADGLRAALTPAGEV